MGTWAHSIGRGCRGPLLTVGLGAIALAMGCAPEEPSSSDGSGTGAGTVAPSKLGGPTICTPQPLSALCRTSWCPKRESDVELQCGERSVLMSTIRYETPCGGVAVEHVDSAPFERWYFDESGALVGAATNASGPGCAQPLGSVFGLVFGDVCPPTTPGIDLCHAACPAGHCIPRTSIVADFPLALADTVGMKLEVCRSSQCALTELPYGLELGQELVPESITTDDAQFAEEEHIVKIWFGPGTITPLVVNVVWTLRTIDFPARDRYLIWLLGDDNLHPADPLIDVNVTYEQIDLGCGGTCRVADLDLRTAATTETPDGP